MARQWLPAGQPLASMLCGVCLPHQGKAVWALLISQSPGMTARAQTVSGQGLGQAPGGPISCLFPHTLIQDPLHLQVPGEKPDPIEAGIFLRPQDLGLKHTLTPALTSLLFYLADFPAVRGEDLPWAFLRAVQHQLPP